MNVLFLTMGRFDSIESHSIYADLLRTFRNEGHNVCVINPHERKIQKKTECICENGAKILHVKTGNVTSTNNRIVKGFAQILIGYIYINAIKRYFSKEKFDIVLYSTPPITFVSAIEYVKKRDGARTYLLLKDIFPQNAVDIGMMSKNGIKGILYKYFRKKEKKLYRISDRIGCMSQANVDYIIKHNSYINPKTVEICPNSIEVIDKSIDEKSREEIRKKYGIPLDKKVFVYGGNLGKPQGIPFLIKCLKKCADISNAFFLIVGDGTEYHLLKEYVEKCKQKNLRLMRRLPKEDYDTLVGACDVGMIFLDYRFTIPNFPSRLLSYMQAKLPILACTDSYSDIGKEILRGEFGWWCLSDIPNSFVDKVFEVLESDLKGYGERAFDYLELQYNVKKCVQHILRT